ncbi:MAG: enoyl-CoA hydratase/isomerase family protein [Deltaproteobacteria bacterium]|nr:enoyl-CoA hydratase/isomerase family protein [Deltaproteobacteria bacterium]MBW2142769.1 enoyl-CoA hydratase/isomerase family protein [Deltaproteobacteria bacterium]
MSYETIIFKKKDNVAYITFNSPERMNAVRLEFLEEFVDALRDVEKDNSIGVVVAKGAGDAFCVGGDISMFKDFDLQSGRATADECFRLGSVMRRMGQPIIASVHGFCMGWGLEFVTFSDLCIAADNAVFEQPELKVGSTPMWGATQMFPLMIGDKRAKEAVLLSKRFTAEEAEDWGLINKVVPLADLENETDKWCKRILSMSPQSTRTAKIAMNALPDLLGMAYRHAVAIVPHMWSSPEGSEAFKSFKEKRRPDFTKFRKK